MQDVGNDVTLLRITAELGQRRAEAGAAAAAASRGIRTAAVGVRRLTHAEELDAHVGTARALRAETERVALTPVAVGLVGGPSVGVVTLESAAFRATRARIHRSNALLCITEQQTWAYRQSHTLATKLHS